MLAPAEFGEGYGAERRIGAVSTWLTTHVVLASLIILLCSGAVRLFMVLRATPDELVVLYSDAATYLVPAHSLVEHGVFLDNRDQPNFHRTPGYPVFLACIMAVVGTDLRTVLLAQTLILSFGPPLLYLLARRILSPTAAIVAGLIAALSPWGAVLAIVPMSDGLFLAVLIAIFLLMKITVDADKSRAPVVAAGVGVLASVAVLVRPIWPLVILVPVALAFCLWPKRQGVWLLSAVCVVCAVTPTLMWTERNRREAHFNGLSDVPGQTVWQFLAARVRADISGRDRFEVSNVAAQDESTWGVPFWTQALDDQRWQHARAVFQQHPFTTGRMFALDALEHTIHPSPDILIPAKLNFRGDVAVLAVAWGALLTASAYGLWQRGSSRHGDLDRRMAFTMLAICMALTLSSGISFGAGSRLRAPLEAIVPLLAAAGLMRRADEMFQGRAR